MQIKVFLNQLARPSKPRPLLHSVFNPCETDVAHSQHPSLLWWRASSDIGSHIESLISSCLSETIIQGLSVPEALSAAFTVVSGYACCLMVLRYDFKVLYLEYLVFRTTEILAPL